MNQINRMKCRWLQLTPLDYIHGIHSKIPWWQEWSITTKATQLLPGGPWCQYHRLNRCSTHRGHILVMNGCPKVVYIMSPSARGLLIWIPWEMNGKSFQSDNKLSSWKSSPFSQRNCRHLASQLQGRKHWESKHI